MHMEFIIYKPESLKLEHTSTAKEHTNDTINLPSHSYLSNSGS